MHSWWGNWLLVWNPSIIQTHKKLYKTRGEPVRDDFDILVKLHNFWVGLQKQYKILRITILKSFNSEIRTSQRIPPINSSSTKRQTLLIGTHMTPQARSIYILVWKQGWKTNTEQDVWHSGSISFQI